MKTATALREQLSEVFADLRGNKITHSEAAALANLAGKLITSAKVQLDYHNARQEKVKIIFLHSTDK